MGCDSMSQQKPKSAKRLNVFLLLADVDAADKVIGDILTYCKDLTCVCTPHKSIVVKRFLYIECVSQMISLEEMKKRIEELISSRLAEIVAWYKVEVIEVK